MTATVVAFGRRVSVRAKADVVLVLSEAVGVDAEVQAMSERWALTASWCCPRPRR